MHLPLTRPCVAALLLSPLASAQLLVPIDQDRHVGAEAVADDNGTVIPDADTDAALDYGPFVSTVHAQVNQSGLSEGGGWQDSQLLPDSFVASGTSFATAISTCDTWNHLAEGVSIAKVVFPVAQPLAYHVYGRVVGYGLGYGAWELTTDSGLFIEGSSGTHDGVNPIDFSGLLLPGAYAVGFRAASGASSSGCDTSTGAAAFELRFDLVEAPSRYCSTAPNSVGAGALIGSSGSQSIGANSLELHASGAIPNQFGLFYYGAGQTQLPFGDGLRCVSGQLFRLNPPQMADGSGALVHALDFTSGPAASGPGQILPHSTWNFQLWYRDPSGPGGSGYNLSDALQVRFLP